METQNINHILQDRSSQWRTYQQSHAGQDAPFQEVTRQYRNDLKNDALPYEMVYTDTYHPSDSYHGGAFQVHMVDDTIQGYERSYYSASDWWRVEQEWEREGCQYGDSARQKLFLPGRAKQAKMMMGGSFLFSAATLFVLLATLM